MMLGSSSGSGPTRERAMGLRRDTIAASGNGYRGHPFFSSQRPRGRRAVLKAQNIGPGQTAVRVLVAG